MSKIEEQELGEALETCVFGLFNSIAVEVQTLGEELSSRLAFHFADAIAQSCAKLHAENSYLRQQLNGNTNGCLRTTQHSDTVSEISSSAPLIYLPPEGNRVSNSCLLGVPPIRLETIRSSNDDCGDDNYTKSPISNMAGALAKNDLPSERAVDKAESSSVADWSSPRSNNSRKDDCELEDPDGVAGRRRTSRLWRDISEFSFGNRSKSTLHCIVNSKCFEGFFNVIIVLNCFSMGVEANQIIHYDDVVASCLEVGEHVLTVLFLIELILRMYVFGWRAFVPGLSKSKDVALNFMDAFLVLITGVLFSWIMPLLARIFKFSAENDIARTLTVLRAVRLLRLVRVFQRVPAFREAWLLLRGLTDSVRTLFWTCFVIMFITYIFAIFGMVGVTKPLYERRQNLIDDPERYETLSELLEYVGGLDLLIVTLIQLLTMDSWNFFLRKILKELPLSWVYFYAYIAVAVFVLMNLVTAIIVNNALDNAKVDEEHIVKQREKAKKEELRSMEELFVRMDTDGSGTLNWQEFKDAFSDPLITMKWKMLDFEPDECKELFALLDDGDGEIETLEFFEGLAKMKGTAQSKDIFRLQKTLAALHNSLLDDQKSVRTASIPHPSHSEEQSSHSHSRMDRKHADDMSATTTFRTQVRALEGDLDQSVSSNLQRHIRNYWSKLSHDMVTAASHGYEGISTPLDKSHKKLCGCRALLSAKVPGDTSNAETPIGLASSKIRLQGTPWIPPAAIQNPGYTWRI